MKGLVEFTADNVIEAVRRGMEQLLQDALRQHLHTYEGITLYAVHAHPAGANPGRVVTVSYPEALDYLRTVEVPLLPRDKRAGALEAIEQAPDKAPDTETPVNIHLADRRDYRILEVSGGWFMQEVVRKVGQLEINRCPQRSHCAGEL